MIIDRTQQRPDYVLLATVGALVAFGLVMVYSASFVEGLVRHENPFYYLMRQCVGAAIGVGGMLIAQRINHRIWRRYSVYLMGLAILLLVAVLLLPAEITEVNGARSWIRFGDGVFGLFSVQPSEFAKLAVIIYFAHWLSRRSDRVGHATYGLLPFALMLGVVCGLIMLEPDLGTTIVIVIIGGAIFFAAGANLLHVLFAALIGSSVFWVLINSARAGRMAAFWDPWSVADSSGYQIIHALYAFGSGGLLGEGLGFSRQKYQWLPQSHTDTIYAIVGEELGLIGTLAVLAAFVIIAYRGYRIAGRAPSPFAALVAVGITTWITFQGLVNIAVTIGLIPFTGLTLPFLSYGSTSLISCLIAVGILLNISRYTGRSQPQEEPDAPPIIRPALTLARRAEPDPLGRRDRRSRLSGAGGRWRAR